MPRPDTNNGDKPALPVSSVLGHDISQMLALEGTPRRQPMAGFESDYVDIVDYIIRLTHRIWEERNVGLIYNHYGSNSVVHTSDGDYVGRDKVISETVKMQGAFPDLRLFAEDVIWNGDEVNGFHSSHRVVWVARNTGYSRYGAPTGQRVVYREIAHCIVKEDRIVEEWTSRDELSMVWQLGYNATELARKVALQEAESGSRPPIPIGTGEVERLLGQTTPEEMPPPSSGAFDPEYFVRRAIHEIWNWRMFGKVRDYYAPTFQSYNSGNRTLYGWGDFQAFVTQMLAAFPDGRMLVDHVIVNGDAQAGYRVAVRWYFQGTHQGPGIYGDPSGKPVQVIGTTHYQIENEKLVKEWCIFDEFSILKQIHWPV